MSRESRSDTPFADFAAGGTILHQGEAATALYIIEAGKVAIEWPDAPGTALAELGPGDLFGEAALLQDAMHATNAVARTAVRALRIDAASLHAVLRENVDVSVQLLRRLTQRLRAADERRAMPRATEPARASEAPRDAGDGVRPAAAAVPPPPSVPAAAPPAAEAAAGSPKPSKEPKAPVPASPSPVASAPAPEPAPAPVVPARPRSFVLLHTQGSIPLPDGKLDCLVGRPDPATGAIPEINLGPLDLARSLSRRHARLLVEEGGVVLREEPGVANGTWVNGERVPTGQGVKLKPGDKLRFGAIELELAVA